MLFLKPLYIIKRLNMNEKKLGNVYVNENRQLKLK